MASRAAALMLSMALLAPVQGPPIDLAAREQAAMREALSAMLATPRKQPMRAGSWILHPEGFGFLIPEGMQLQSPPRGSAVSLVSESRTSRARANIQLAVTREDTQLHRITEKDVEGAARLQGFARVSLVSFERIDYQGEEGLRYSFLAGRSPRMFFEVYVFNRAGKNYSLTLNVEHDLRQMETALHQFGIFRDSLFFVD